MKGLIELISKKGEPFTDCERPIDNFGAWFKRERKSQKITLKKVAKASGVSIGNISDIENGKVVPSIKTASLIMAEIGRVFLICEVTE